MEANTGIMREFCQSGKVGTVKLIGCTKKKTMCILNEDLQTVFETLYTLQTLIGFQPISDTNSYMERRSLTGAHTLPLVCFNDLHDWWFVRATRLVY